MTKHSQTTMQTRRPARFAALAVAAILACTLALATGVDAAERDKPSRRNILWIVGENFNLDFGCYGANLMTWLMGGHPPLTITAVTQQLQPELYGKVEDEATVILTYPAAQGIIQASWNWPSGRKDTHVYGEGGAIHALDAELLHVRIGDGEVEEMEVPPPPVPFDDAFAYLAAVVRGQVSPGPTDLSSLPLNLTVVEILDAARESAFTGRRIDLREPSPRSRGGR